MNILAINLLFSTFVFAVAARIYLVPRLHRMEPRAILVPVLLLHPTRHFGLMFLAAGATYPGLPSQFAYPAAFGDLLAAVLALAVLPAVLKRSRAAKTLVESPRSGYARCWSPTTSPSCCFGSPGPERPADPGEPDMHKAPRHSPPLRYSSPRPPNG